MPVMTLGGVIVFIALILATWPVWGIFTPLIMLVLLFGTSFSMVFLPSGNFGTLLFWIALLTIGYFVHTMPHDPVW